MRITRTNIEEEKVDMIYPQQDDQPYKLPSKLFAEFLGTMLFVFIGKIWIGVILNAILGSMSGLKTVGLDGIVHAAFAHGFTIFVLVTSLGHVR